MSINKPVKEFDSYNLEKFLLWFDAIHYKYEVPNPNTKEGIKKFREEQKLSNLYLELVDEEAKTYTFDLRNHDYSEIYHNLKLIYGEIENVEKFVDIYKIVHEKILGQYLNIEGLDKLYNQEFFNYEWELHMGINYTKQESDFYRDHFIHQVRNLYEIHAFLDDLHLIENCIKILFPNGQGIYAPNDTHIAKYISKMSILALDSIKNDKQKFELYNKVCKCLNNRCADDKWLGDNILKYIIRSASYIAALFHDIGYPIESVLKNRRRISNFFPNIHFFVESMGHFDEICGLLSNTLLFTIVKKNEIEKRYNNLGKAHGVISALALLLYYYESGTIYSLAPEKRAAIELAAVAIYDHTINPKYIDKKSEEPYYRLLFYINPISYIFRLCDDIQEWERMYFGIYENSNLKICHKCKTPILRVPVNIDERLEKEPRPCSEASCLKNNCKENNCLRSSYIIKEKYVKFLKSKNEFKVDKCACYGTEECFNRQISTLLSNGFLNNKFGNQFIEFDDTEFRKRSDILFRKMHHIKTCHTVSIFAKYEKSTPPDNILIDINFSAYKLLQMSFIAPEFAKYRSQEVWNIKKFLEMQDGFPRTLIKSDITTNPITLKVKILQDFLESFNDAKISSIKKLIINKPNNHADWENLISIIFKSDINDIRTRILKQINFYLYLGELSKEYKDTENALDLWKKDLSEHSVWKAYYGKNSVVDYLIDDYLLTCEYKKEIDYDKLDKHEGFLPKAYYNIYKIDDRLIENIRQFCNESNYRPFDLKEDDGLDAFIDLYFFKVLANYRYAEFRIDSEEEHG